MRLWFYAFMILCMVFIFNLQFSFFPRREWRQLACIYINIYIYIYIYTQVVFTYIDKDTDVHIDR